MLTHGRRACKGKVKKRKDREKGALRHVSEFVTALRSEEAQTQINQRFKFLDNSIYNTHRDQH